MHDLVATVPGAELVIIPQAGHSPQFENPPAWLSAMEAFLVGL
jgi:pimeloyl-ACP methyl ester carboxylesterase